MPNSLTIRLTAPGATQTAQDLNGVKSAAQGAGSTLKTSFGGLDVIDNSMGKVTGKLQELSKNSRLLGRESKGVLTFANALDTIAGTNFAGTIQDIKTVAEVADPLKNIGQEVIDKIKSLLPGATAAGASVGVAEGEAEVEGATGPGMVTKFLQKFGLMTGEKVAVAAVAGEAEGVAEGEAMGGPAALGAAGASGTALGTALAVAVPAGLFAVGGGVSVAIENWLNDNVFKGTPDDPNNLLNALGHKQGAALPANVAAGVEDGIASGAMDGPPIPAGFFSPKVFEQVGFTAGQSATTGLGHGSDAGITGVASDLAKTWAANATLDQVANKYADIIKGPLKSKLMDAAEGTAAAAARTTAETYAQNILDNGKTNEKAWQDFVNEMQHPLDVGADIAKIKGEMTGKMMVAGLASTDPLVRAEAQREYDQLQSQLDQYAGLGYDTGTSLGKNDAKGIVASTPGAVDAAAALARKVNAALSNINSNIHITVSGGEQYGHGGGGAAHYAAGGRYQAGKPRIVGEKGPELDVPDHSGTIVPAGSSAAMAPANIAVTVQLSTRNVIGAQKHYATVNAGGPAFG